MANQNEVEAKFEIVTGQSEANLERLDEGLRKVDATAETVAATATGALQAQEGASQLAAEAAVETASAVEDSARAIEQQGQAAQQAARGVEELSAASRQVAVSLEEATAAGEQFGPGLSDGMRDVQGQIGLVEGAIAKFYERLEQGLAPSRGALRQITAQYAILGEQIAEAEGLTSGEATVAQESFTRIGAAIQGVITKQREFRFEMEAAQIGTKETSSQLGMMGLLAEHVGKQFGEAGEVVGNMAGQAGLLAMMWEHLAKAAKGLQLNDTTNLMRLLKGETDGLSASSGQLAIQMGAVAATFVAFVAAGVKVAESNEDNAQMIEHLKKTYHDAFRDMGGDLTGFVGQMQAAFQVIAADVFNAATRTSEFEEALNLLQFGDVTAGVNKLGSAFDHLAYEIFNAMNAATEHRKAMHAAITELQAEAQVAKESAEMQKRVAEAMTAVRHAVDSRTAAQRVLAEATNHVILTDAQAAAASAKHALDLVAESQKVVKAKTEEARAAKEVVDVMEKSAKAKNDESEKTKKAIEAAEKAAHVKELEAEAARKAAEKLKEEADAAEKNAKALEHAAEVSKKFSDLTHELADAVREETGAESERESPIQRVVKRMQEEMAANVDLTDATRARMQQLIEAAKEIDALQAKQSKLTKTEQEQVKVEDDVTAAFTRHSAAIHRSATEVESLSDVTRANFDAFVAEAKAIKAHNDEMERNHGLTDQQAAAEKALATATSNVIEQKRKEFEALQKQNDELQKQATATSQISAGTVKLTGDLKDGTAAISNVTDSAVKMTGSLKEGTAEISNVAESAVKLSGALEKGTAEISNVAGSIDKVAEGVKKLDPQLALHALQVDKMKSAYQSAGDALKSGIVDSLDKIEDKLDRINEKFGVMAQKINDAAAAGAAGGAT